MLTGFRPRNEKFPVHQGLHGAMITAQMDEFIQMRRQWPVALSQKWRSPVIRLSHDQWHVKVCADGPESRMHC